MASTMAARPMTTPCTAGPPEELVAREADQVGAGDQGTGGAPGAGTSAGGSAPGASPPRSITNGTQAARATATSPGAVGRATNPVMR
ncbi:MAG: hypothetical protein U1F43_00245 [Myxococcota bacterium]